MDFQFFCPRWGSESISWPEFCRKVKEAGYSGVETSLPLGDRAGTDLILRSLANEGLLLIAQHWETFHPDWDTHSREYLQRLEWLAAAKPVFINSQTGRDWFSFEENQKLVVLAREFSQRKGIPLYHETHRGKFPYSAAVTARFLREDPALMLSVDFSHWCVVSESLLADQKASVDLAISRARHIHARVGHAEAPQISDPRAPEWKDALDAHLGWWDQIIAQRKSAGDKVLTITPEFGPAPYMPALPFTNQPVTDQWSANLFMMELLKKR